MSIRSNKFKNNSRGRASSKNVCGFDLNEIELSAFDKEIIKDALFYAKQKQKQIDKIKEVRKFNNRDLHISEQDQVTGNIVTYEESELIYLPVTVSQFKKEVEGVSYGIYTNQEIEGMINNANLYLSGNGRPSHASTNIPQPIDSDDHGVECKYRLRLANKLPVNFFKNWLNTINQNGFASSFYRDTYIDIVEGTEDDYYIGVPFRGVTSISFTNAALDEATQAAQQAKDSAFMGYKEGDPLTPEQEKTDKILKYGGLVNCGQYGAIFTFDFQSDAYDTLRLATIHNIQQAEAQDYGVNYVQVANAIDAINDTSTASRYSMPFRQMRITTLVPDSDDDLWAGHFLYWVNRLPTINIILHKDDVISQLKYSGAAYPPFQSGVSIGKSGSTVMDTISSEVFMHELGHIFNLPHYFSGSGTTPHLTTFKAFSPDFKFPLGTTGTDEDNNPITTYLDEDNQVVDISYEVTNFSFNTLQDNDKQFLQAAVATIESVNSNFDVSFKKIKFATQDYNSQVVKNINTITFGSEAVTDQPSALAAEIANRKKTHAEFSLIPSVFWGGSIDETQPVPNTYANENLAYAQGNPSFVFNKAENKTYEYNLIDNSQDYKYSISNPYNLGTALTLSNNLFVVPIEIYEYSLYTQSGILFNVTDVDADQVSLYPYLNLQLDQIAEYDENSTTTLVIEYYIPQLDDDDCIITIEGVGADNLLTSLISNLDLSDTNQEGVSYIKEDEYSGYGTLTFSINSGQKYESLNLRFGVGSSIVMTSIVFNYTVPILNFRTRIPFCELNDEGNPTDVFDEFWDLNLNYLNPNYPAYPDNTPTYKIYDEEFCPCLHKTQRYINSGEVISYELNWLESGETAGAAEGKVRTYFQFLHDSMPDLLRWLIYDSDAVYIQTSAYYRYKQNLVYPGYSLADVRQEMSFTPSIRNIILKNGHVPPFGFMGIGQFQPLPSLFQIKFGVVDDYFYNYDGYSGSLRGGYYGGKGISNTIYEDEDGEVVVIEDPATFNVTYSHIYNLFNLGVEDSESEFYNPHFKLSGNITSVMPPPNSDNYIEQNVDINNQMLFDAKPNSNVSYNINQFYGVETTFGKIDVSFMYNAMHYNYSNITTYVQDSNGDYKHFDYYSLGVRAEKGGGEAAVTEFDSAIADSNSIFTRGSLVKTTKTTYSPQQINFAEYFLDYDIGPKFGRAKEFSQLIDLANPVLTETNQITAIQSEIETFIKDYNLDDLGVVYGCTDNQAVNFNANANIDDGTCIIPGEDCHIATVEIKLCDDVNNVTVCNPATNEQLEHIPAGQSESGLLSNEAYPIIEGCTGGGYKYSIDNDTCRYGTIEFTNCQVGPGLADEDVILYEGVEYTVNGCSEILVKTNLYTTGGLYYNSDGTEYTGIYTERDDGIIFSGNINSIGDRIYTKNQIPNIITKVDSLQEDAKKFKNIVKHIQNICSFVELQQQHG